MTSYLIFREVPVTDSAGKIMSYNHVYLGPFTEPEAEEKYQRYLKARIPHESVLKLELGKLYNVEASD